ncbi:MAG: DNA replication/repair protein RecF [Flavobacteriales bacterium]|nr:DNA replication/repair protein RecF [Flavobacteriales bacterium]MDG1766103.1 DNA replication/repair protein RecF [Flavobacteriales bacterium]
MHLDQLSLINFKNYEAATFAFSPEVNCLVGLNGSGKTNVLDAVYYLSFCKSYFNVMDTQNVRHNEGFFMVQGEFMRNDERDQVQCAVKKGQKKKVSRNKKEYTRLADHIGKYPAVMISPNDTDIIREGSEVRRKFIDGVISQYNKAYLDQLIQYNKVLLQRNNLLRYFAENRTFDAENLEVWDAQLANIGSAIHEERKLFLEAFVPGFNDIYQRISGAREVMSIEYKSDYLEGSFSDLLREAQQKDRQLRRSTVGIHKDDLIFLIDGHPLKRFGSQGQQKSVLIALKLAQFEFIERATKVKPILLLDDIFDKLDDTRVAHLMKLVSEHHFGQIFITDTHDGRVPDLFKATGAAVKVFKVNNAQIDELNSESNGAKK